MNYLPPLIATGICTITLIMGMFVIALDPVRKLHRLYFISAISAVLFSLSAIYAFSINDKNVFILCYRIGISILLISVPVTLYLIMEMAEVKNRIKTIISIFFLLAAVCLILYNISSNLYYKNFIKEGYFWHLIKADGIITFSGRMFFLLYYITCYYFIFKWRRGSVLKREKKQTTILLIFISLLILFLAFDKLILPCFTENNFGLFVYYSFIWPFGIGLSIARYRYMAVSPLQISRDIIENIEESVIILDMNLNVFMANRKTHGIISLKNGINISKIITEYEFIKNDILHIMDGKIPEIKTRLGYLQKGKQKTDLSANISPVKDKYGDVIGILIFAKEIKGIREFMSEYGITERETDIIALLITGIPVQEIADKLSINKSTAKTHIDHIYNKTHVRNKLELMNLTREYDFTAGME